jgi:hypothetical protein
VASPHPASHGRFGGSTRASARLRRRLAWGGIGIAALVGLVLVLVLGPNKNAPVDHFSSTPAQVAEPQVKAPLTQEARRVAIRFIQTAVARENLEEAWSLVGPNLRGGLTRERWITGANPVVPYPIDELDVAPYKVDESFETSALLEVALLPRKGSGVRAQIFFLQLRRIGTGTKARWVVDNWVPRASAVVPR